MVQQAYQDTWMAAPAFVRNPKYSALRARFSAQSQCHLITHPISHIMTLDAAAYQDKCKKKILDVTQQMMSFFG